MGEENKIITFQVTVEELECLRQCVANQIPFSSSKDQTAQCQVLACLNTALPKEGKPC